MRHVLSAGIAVVAAACTFPGVTYSSDPAGGDSVSGEGGATHDADATVDIPSRDGDSRSPADALDYAFEAAADASACDQDEDGYQAIGGMCGGGDCDDQDKRAYPGEPNYLTALPRATTMYGDWNCNHIVEKEFAINVDCTTSILRCGTTNGFTGDPPCGTYGTFVQCVTMNLGLCGVGATSMQLQACK
jgi:hypothetical protein